VVPGLHVASAVFYSNIEDNIQNAFIAANGNNPPNVALVGIAPDGHYQRAEISADYDVNRELRVGGHYTYIDRDLNFVEAGLSGPTITPAIKSAVALNQMEGLPMHKAFFYLACRATNQLTLTPSLELASDRVALVTSCASTLVQTGGSLTPPNANNGNCRRIL
jgi:iron complex outermembrane receptor protein